MKEKSMKRASVLKRKNDRKGSFPKCAGENDMKMEEKAGMVGMLTNVKKENMPENEGKEGEKDF